MQENLEDSPLPATPEAQAANHAAIAKPDPGNNWDKRDAVLHGYPLRREFEITEPATIRKNLDDLCAEFGSKRRMVLAASDLRDGKIIIAGQTEEDFKDLEVLLKQLGLSRGKMEAPTAQKQSPSRIYEDSADGVASAESVA